MVKKGIKNNTDKVINIWCATCGDTTIYSPEIHWKIKDEARGIGICCLCAEVLDEEYLVLPNESEDGYAAFD